jgi:hypothetical protein
MAEAGLFTGWGPPVRGREAKGLDVFNEALSFYGKQQESGAIESFEVVFLAPHGGDLAGFILVRGSEEQIASLRASDDFQRLNTRAGLIVERFGVVDAVVDEAIGAQMAVYQEAIGTLS